MSAWEQSNLDGIIQSEVPRTRFQILRPSVLVGLSVLREPRLRVQLELSAQTMVSHRILMMQLSLVRLSRDHAVSVIIAHRVLRVLCRREPHLLKAMETSVL